MKSSDANWTKFHIEKAKTNYPMWPIEAMLKLVNGDYLNSKINLTKSSKVLDIGCGFGNNLLPFILKGYECHGIEITKEMADTTQILLKERGFENVTVQEGCNTALPFEDNTFDLIISNNVLHYEKDEDSIKKALKEYSRVLTTSGSLFMMTVAPEHDIYKRAKPLGNHRYQINDYDFRNGEIYFYFDSEKYLNMYLAEFFDSSEIGRVTENLMRLSLDFFVSVSQNKKV